MIEVEAADGSKGPLWFSFETPKTQGQVEISLKLTLTHNG